MPYNEKLEKKTLPVFFVFVKIRSLEKYKAKFGGQS